MVHTFWDYSPGEGMQNTLIGESVEGDPQKTILTLRVVKPGANWHDKVEIPFSIDFLKQVLKDIPPTWVEQCRTNNGTIVTAFRTLKVHTTFILCWSLYHKKKRNKYYDVDDRFHLMDTSLRPTQA